MYPVDIDKAINCDDGTILNYNKDGVEEQELCIIRELEDNIKRFLSRWHVNNYIITDELYLPSLIGVMYSIIPATIMNLRSNYIYTAQANSFHLEQFFKSRLNVWEQIKDFDNKTKYWLYQNLNYLMVNTSKNKTLNIILKEVFDSNNIGVGNVTLEQRKNRSLNSDNCLISNVSEAEVIFSNEKSNKTYDVEQDSHLNVNFIVRDQLNRTNIKNISAINSTITEVKDKISKTKINKQKTKVLDINNNTIFKGYCSTTTVL